MVNSGSYGSIKVKAMAEITTKVIDMIKFLVEYGALIVQKY